MSIEDYSCFRVGTVPEVSNQFEAIYRANVDVVFRYALRLVGNRELAEDITSEAFLELYRHRDSVDASRLPGWLLTVARNRAVDYWRKVTSERRHAELAAETVTQPMPELHLQVPTCQRYATPSLDRRRLREHECSSDWRRIAVAHVCRSRTCPRGAGSFSMSPSGQIGELSGGSRKKE